MCAHTIKHNHGFGDCSCETLYCSTNNPWKSKTAFKSLLDFGGFKKHSYKTRQSPYTQTMVQNGQHIEHNRIETFKASITFVNIGYLCNCFSLYQWLPNMNTNPTKNPSGSPGFCNKRHVKQPPQNCLVRCFRFGSNSFRLRNHGYIHHQSVLIPCHLVPCAWYNMYLYICLTFYGKCNHNIPVTLDPVGPCGSRIFPMVAGLPNQGARDQSAASRLFSRLINDGILKKWVMG